ncbi:MAG: leucine-rich repeat protein [Lachnospiraceae bacterium]|nr:leucine-rich repeat protein [Lachnospiraceae bacterium]
MTEKRCDFCGEKVFWKYETKTGKMTVYGEGPMTDYEDATEAPWHDLRNQMKELVVAKGVTTLGDYSFVGCSQLMKVSLPSTLESLGVYSLSKCALTEVVIPDGVRLICAKAFEANGELWSVTIPVSVKAIDMKAFNQTPKLRRVFYKGTKSRWEAIRISVNAMGNQFLYNAQIEYRGKLSTEKPDECDLHAHCTEREMIPVLDRAREILYRGGDGSFYVLALNLTTDGLAKKPGDCTLLIFPNGQTMMIDSGCEGCRERVLKAIERLELKSLDYFTLSHPHADHVGNAMAVAKYIDERGGIIGTYFYTGHPFRTLEPSFAAFLSEHGTKMDNCLRTGDVRKLGEVTMEIFGPSEKKMTLAPALTPEHLNRLSLIQKFTFGKASYLTSGDLYRVDEREAIAEHGDRLRATVAKTNHHGVYTSNCDEWVEAISPEVFLVTSDDIGATRLEARAARLGIGYYSSGLDGDVLVRMTKEGHVELETAYGKTYCK